MKKLLGILLAAVLLVSALSVVVFAGNAVAYVSYNTGKDANNGLSVATPKRNVVGEAGALEIVKDGGTLVVTEKIFFPEDYTFQANGPVTITAKYGGKNYINPEPADNPAAGAFKIGHNRTLTIASDLTFENIYMVSENNKDTLLVKSGATLTIDETVMSVRRMAKYFHIVVEKGGKAVINGGTFSSVTGEGEIVIGEKAVVESTGAEGSSAPMAVGSNVVYINFAKGNNEANDGLTPDTPKKSFGNKTNGALSLLQSGGTAVFTGNNTIESNYTWSVAGGTVWTASHNGTSYVNEQTKTGLVRLNKGITVTVKSDLTLKDIILLHEGDATNTILVTSGATLTVDSSVITKSTGGQYCNIVVEAGATAIINGGTFASVTGAGKIVTDGSSTTGGNTTGGNTGSNDPMPVGSNVVFINYAKGNNDTFDGLSPETPKKSFGNKTTGALGLLQSGGTAVFTGNNTIESNYTWSVAGGTVWTAKYNDISYVDTAKNQGLLRLNKGITVTVKSDLTLKDIILLHDGEAPNTILVTDGATLTIEDSVITSSPNGMFCNIVVDAGATAIINGGTFASVTGSGTIKQGDEIKVTKTVQLTIGSRYAYINGVPETMDVAPIIKNSRTMLPVRFLANTFGIENDGIVWDDATKTATLKDAETTIVITIGAPSMTVNGESVALDSPAIIENSRTYLPVRAIANALGVSNDNITWDDATKTATLIG